MIKMSEMYQKVQRPITQECFINRVEKTKVEQLCVSVCYNLCKNLNIRSHFMRFRINGKSVFALYFVKNFIMHFFLNCRGIHIMSLFC